MSNSLRSERREAGLTLVEVLVASVVMLLLVLAVYQVTDWAQRSYTQRSDQVNSRATGRAVLELLGRDVRVAGYSPLGTAFDAVTDGNTMRVRMLADLDGDGVVATATETGETVSWQFVGPDGNGVYEIWRGVDLDGDWNFTDTGDSSELIATEVVAIDLDGDGANESFLTYDAAPPGTTRIRVAFGVRSQHRDTLKRDFEVARYATEIALRNRMLN